MSIRHDGSHFAIACDMNEVRLSSCAWLTCTKFFYGEIYKFKFIVLALSTACAGGLDVVDVDGELNRRTSLNDDNAQGLYLIIRL